MTHSRTHRRLSSLFTVLMTAAFMFSLVGVAHAVPPTGNFLNPDEDGPGSIVSDRPDGTDGLYHFVVRARSLTGGRDIQSVQIQIEDCDADADFESIGNATRVGTTDTWELRWDLTTHQPPGEVAECDTGRVRALITDTGGETSFAPSAQGEPALFCDANCATVEITNPANGGTLPYFDNRARVTGTASEGTETVNVFFTTQEVAGTDPTWIPCATASVSGGTWDAVCDTGVWETSTANVTGIAARAGNEIGSGDAHRVFPQQQQANQVRITPTSDNQTTGFCNAYTVEVLDTQGRPIIGRNVDVHIQGPDDNVSFAQGGDPFQSPNSGHDANQTTATCDANGRSTPGTGNPGTGGTASEQGVHTAPNPDIKHIEGETQTDGAFTFNIASATVGNTAITAWFDANDNDVHDAGELTGTATKTWQAAAETNLTASPQSATNSVGNPHQVTARLTDQNNNPIQGQTVHFRVTSGPHADNDLDGNPSTPPGYFGNCLTEPNGECSQSYIGSEQGTDTITVWIETDGDLTPEQGERQTSVTKRWIQANVCIDLDPNTDTNRTTDTHELVAFVTTGTLTAGTNPSTGDNADEPGQVDNDCTGDPIEGVQVRFTATDTPDVRLVPNTNPANDENVEIVTTDANGRATVTLDNVDDQTEGTTAITVDTVNTGSTGDKDASKTWLRAGRPENIDCTPDFDLNATGTQHRVTARVTDPFGDPVDNARVDMRVEGGPHSDNDLDQNPNTPVGYFLNDGMTTNGQVTGSYTGTETGTDFIRCWIDLNQNNELDPDTEPSDVVQKNWRTAAEIGAANVEIDMQPTGGGNDDTEPGTPNTKGCEFVNGQPMTTAPPTWEATTTGPVNGVELVCVTVRDADNVALVGAEVTLQSSGVGAITDERGQNPSASKTAVVDPDGYAEFYVLSTQVGTQTLTASATGVTDTDIGTKDWTVATAEARLIDCQPETPQAQPGQNQEVVCTVTDGLGNRVPGVAVSWMKTDAGGASSSWVFQQATTDTNGQARATVVSPSEGTTTVTGSLSSANTECGAAAGQPHTGANNPATAPPAGERSWDTNKPVGSCSDSAQLTWRRPPPPPPARRCPGQGNIQGNHIVGTNGNDLLRGTRGRDVICGLRGNDRIFGLGGDDLLQGQGDNDLILGGPGDDEMFGGSGNDGMNGNQGDDRMFGGSGNDRLTGAQGNDRMSGQSGNDRFRGSTGDDRIFGGSGNDNIRGQGNDDILNGQSGNDVVVGNAGNDQVRGGKHNDRLRGNAGNDTLVGGQGFDLCNGGAGFNILLSCNP